MNLSNAKEGETVVITKINATGIIKQRLLDMGMTKGSEVRIERYAPLQDPIHLSVKGYSLAIRVSEAENIIVNG